MPIVFDKKYIALLGFILIGAFVYYWIEVPLHQKYIVTVRGISMEVEVAHTDYLRRAGLMGRPHLDEDYGMLFLFPDEAVRSFWMKNTLIPLSIAYIKSDGTISQILDMSPDRWSGKLGEYSSKEKVQYALEVNQGWFKKNFIEAGDQVYLSKSIKRLHVE